jgi:hypothetical protein
MTTQNQLIKNQKPTELDVHLKYRCPECARDHWLALRETQTRGFIIVCECSTIIKPKLIKDIKIQYNKKIKAIAQPAVETIETIEIPEPVVNIIVEKPELIPPDSLIDSCVSVLQTYGFTDTETKDLIHKTYQQHSTCTVSEFIRYCLKNITLGENNNG